MIKWHGKKRSAKSDMQRGQQGRGPEPLQNRLCIQWWHYLLLILPKGVAPKHVIIFLHFFLHLLLQNVGQKLVKLVSKIRHEDFLLLRLLCPAPSRSYYPPLKFETSWTRELWSNRVLLILEKIQFGTFGFFDHFWKFLDFWGFLWPF